MSRPRLLDLFCGAGGCSVGYERAGFEVVGVDINPQPNYPYEFHQADALEALRDYIDEGNGSFGAIHASPPCQAYSVTAKGWNGRDDHPRLVEPVRDLLIEAGVPYVIENVEGAPLLNPIRLCGTGFALRIQRHRLFECSFPAMGMGCAHGRFPADLPALRGQGRGPARVYGVFGTGGGPAKDLDAWKVAMETPWMQTKAEVAESIPPAYTEYIGGYLMAAVERLDVAA